MDGWMDGWREGWKDGWMDGGREGGREGKGGRERIFTRMNHNLGSTWIHILKVKDTVGILGLYCVVWRRGG